MTIHDFVKRTRDHATDRRTARISAGPLLMMLRRHRIPCSIDSLSPNGWTARLGDPSNGLYSQQGYFRTLDAAAEWLFKRVTAVVHHGGAGTTACGLINGRPTTIVPFFGEYVPMLTSPSLKTLADHTDH